MSDDTRTMLIKAVHEGGDIMFGGVEGDLIDIQVGTHDIVFDYIVSRIERFAHGGIPHGTLIGEGVWVRDGDSWTLQTVNFESPIIAKYGVENVSEDDIDLTGTPYEHL